MFAFLFFTFFIINSIYILASCQCETFLCGAYSNRKIYFFFHLVAYLAQILINFKYLPFSYMKCVRWAKLQMWVGNIIIFFSVLTKFQAKYDILSVTRLVTTYITLHFFHIISEYKKHRKKRTKYNWKRMLKNSVAAVS